MQILMIDDESKLREKVNKYLALKGYQLLEAGTGEAGLAILAEQEVDLVLLDLRMPGMDGLTCLEKIKDQGWTGEVIMISAHGEIQDAVTAMKLGAYDYLTKPFRLDELLSKVQKVEVKYQSRLRVDTPKGLVFASLVMQELVDSISRVAPSDVPVLLLGETGVGKEVIARSIHQLSGRQGEFIAINCGAIPENLMESELFGHEKGAFSGAYQRKLGKLELAQGGTIFLDEIGELPKAMQVKLLRVLQEHILERVGGTQGIQLDLRVIAATNRDLHVEMAEGRFREDLYYRLNVITFKIPPLRERREDIMPLAHYFIQEMNQKLGKQVTRMSTEAEEILSNYYYPGNVRELKNIIERSMVLSTGQELRVYLDTESTNISATASKKKMIQATTLAHSTQANHSSMNQMTLEELEAMRIQGALARHEGNRTRAAKELGVSRRTIINKIKLYDLE